MYTHRIIAKITIACAIISMPAFGAESGSTSVKSSWLDTLLGRNRQAEQEALTKKIEKRVNPEKIRLEVREKKKDIAKKKLSPEQEQQLEDEIRKSQEAAIKAARKRAQADIEREEWQAAKDIREKQERARALERFKIRKKSHARVLEKAPYGELNEYAYFEAGKEHQQQKLQDLEKNRVELEIFNTFKENPEFIKQAEKKLGMFASNEDIVGEAEKLASKAYWFDRDVRDEQEAKTKALQNEQFWKERGAELSAVKQGVTTKVKSFFDLLGGYQDKFRTRMMELSNARATQELLARQQKLEPLRTEYTKYAAPEELANIRKELTEEKRHWLGYSYTVSPTEKRVQDIAQERRKKEFEDWEKKYRMTIPVTPIPAPASEPQAPTWGQRASNWWTGIKQRLSTPRPGGSNIWLK